MMDSINEMRVINESIKWRIGLILICWLSMLGYLVKTSGFFLNGRCPYSQLEERGLTIH